MSRKPSTAILDTGTVYSPFPVFKLTGGLNTKESPTLIANDESPDLLNVSFDVTGAITKRNGFQKHISAPIPGNAPIDAIDFFNPSNGNDLVMASSDGYVWSWNGSNWQQVDSIGAYPSFEQYYDTFYVADGQKFIQYDGVMAQIVQGAPNGKFLKLCKNRLYLTGDPNAPNRVYFCDLGTPTSWPNLNFLDVDSNDGDNIVALDVFLDQLIIFKSHSTWALFVDGDPSSWVLRCINPEIGCIASNSVSHLGNTLMFLSHQGVYGLHMTKVQNYMNMEYMSFKIEPDMLALTHPENGQAATHKNRYWITFPDDKVTYVYDMILKGWTKYDLYASSLIEFDGSLYSGSAAGYIHQQDLGTNDDGVAINAYLKTKPFDFGIPERIKKMKRLIVFGERKKTDSSITVSVSTDFQPVNATFSISLIPPSNPSSWGSMNWGGRWGATILGESVQRFSISHQARYIQVTLSNNVLDEEFTVRGFTLLYKPKALR